MESERTISGIVCEYVRICVCVCVVKGFEEKQWFIVITNFIAKKFTINRRKNKYDDKGKQKYERKGEIFRTCVTILSRHHPNQSPNRPSRERSRPVTTAMHGMREKALFVLFSEQPWRRKEPDTFSEVQFRRIRTFWKPDVVVLE